MLPMYHQSIIEPIEIEKQQTGAFLEKAPVLNLI